MRSESIMNQESEKWIEVENSKESGMASGEVFAGLSDQEKKVSKNIMMNRKQENDDCFYVRDCDISRKLFDGFYRESNRRF